MRSETSSAEQLAYRMKNRLTIAAVFFLSGLLSAQFIFFGRNKVQYTAFEWKVLRTEHFDIYYYDSLAEISSIGAAYAEEAYSEYQALFNHYLPRKIPLIFYNSHNHFQQTNITQGFIPEGVGGFFEFVKGRIVIPYLGTLEGFRHVIRHELVHNFMTTKVLRKLHEYRLPADRLPPLWFTEGLAEYLSSDMDMQGNMVLRDAVVNGYFASLKDMYSIYGTYQMYKEGQSFLEFAARKYGREKIMLLVDNFWMETNFDKLVEYIFQTTIEKLDEEWLYALRQKYFPLYNNQAPFSQASNQLTKEGFSFSPVCYNAEGRETVFYTANLDGYSSIYSISREHGEKKFSKPELVIRGEKNEELEALHIFQPSLALSSKGTLAATLKSGGSDVIHFYDIAGEKFFNTYRNGDLVTISGPKFSSDGSGLLFQATDKHGYSDLYLLNMTTMQARRLTNDYYSDCDPAFGNNPDEVFFASDRTSGHNRGKYNIFSFSISTGKITQFTNCGVNLTQPKISEDGSRLYFLAEHDSLNNLFCMPLAQSGDILHYYRVTSFLGSIYHPYYSNSKLYFAGFDNRSFKLYQYKLPDSLSGAVYAMERPDTSGQWQAKKFISNSQLSELVYEKEYTLDYAQSQVTTDPLFGTRGGAFLSVSDLFGDDLYYFLLYNTAEVQDEFLKNFNVVLSRISLKGRTNYSYGIFHFRGRRYDIRESDDYFFERSFGGSFELSYPLSKFTRLEADMTLANSDKQVYLQNIDRKALLVSNSVSFVVDNSLWSYTGPIDGIRFRFLLGYTTDIKYSNVNYYSLITDYRHYFRLGLWSSLALRTSLYYNDGKEARRYFMGGSWDLRGWKRWSIRGQKMWISSLELRVPLIDQIMIRFPFMTMGFYGLRLGAFFDAGGAWDTKYTSTIGSIGAGVRLNLFGALVLRYDMGKKIQDNFTRFQETLFYQFFFGWDF